MVNYTNVPLPLKHLLKLSDYCIGICSTYYSQLAIFLWFHVALGSTSCGYLYYLVHLKLETPPSISRWLIFDLLLVTSQVLELTGQTSLVGIFHQHRYVI